DRLSVRIVKLVKLDYVLLQPLEAAFTGSRDVLAGPVLGRDAAPGNVATLAGDVSAAPILGKRLAQHLLAPAIAVHISGIKEVDAQFERATHGGDGILLRRLAPPPLHPSGFACAADRPSAKTD